MKSTVWELYQYQRCWWQFYQWRIQRKGCFFPFPSHDCEGFEALCEFRQSRKCLATSNLWFYGLCWQHHRNGLAFLLRSLQNVFANGEALHQVKNNQLPYQLY